MPGMEMKEMPFKLLCLILLMVSSVACNSSPEKTGVQTTPQATLAALIKKPILPTSSPTTTPILTPTFTPTPAQALCPPFSIDIALPVPDEPQNYIGLHFDALPAGLESPGGSAVDGADTYYLLSEVVRESGAMLWLERNVCHDERGYPYHEVRAVLPLPALQEKEKLITGTCRVKEVATPESETASPEAETVSTFFDPAIVAIGWFEDIHEPPVAIHYAWKANAQAESFEVLSPESVTCTGLEGL